jgi:hypothetical protein
MNKIVNLFRKIILKRLVKKIKKIIQGIESELMDDFLELLLKVIHLVLCVDHNYGKNIEGFKARYAFRSVDGKIAASVIFENNKMKVEKDEIKDTNVTIIFKDGKALWEFLMAEDPDVFSFVLENKLSYNGNLNYLMKFGYMAKHLKVILGIS